MRSLLSTVPKGNNLEWVIRILLYMRMRARTVDIITRVVVCILKKRVWPCRGWHGQVDTAFLRPSILSLSLSN